MKALTNKSIFCTWVSFLTLVASPTILSAADAKPEAEAGIGDSDFLVKDVGTFALGGRLYRIWASVRNDQARSPRQWQFLYESLLQPVRKESKVEAIVSGAVV